MKKFDEIIWEEGFRQTLLNNGERTWKKGKIKIEKRKHWETGKTYWNLILNCNEMFLSVNKATVTRELNRHLYGVETKVESRSFSAKVSSKPVANENGKIEVKLVGEDGNIFNLLGICTRALRRAGQRDVAEKLTEEVFKSQSYDEALNIISEYVDIV